MRILFLTMYFEPLNTIAAYRAVGFVKSWRNAGILCDVITRYYDEEQLKGEHMLLGSQEPRNFNDDFIRKENVFYTRYKSENRLKSVSMKIPRGIRGIYNIRKVDVFHYSWHEYAMKVFEKNLASNKYDCIIASYGPPTVLLTAAKISEKYKIPWIADFRDIFIDENDKGLIRLLKKRTQEKLLQNAMMIVFASEGMRSYFNQSASKKLREKKSLVIYNGVTFQDSSAYAPEDGETVRTFQVIKETYKIVLLHTGTVYPGQNIQFFIDAVNKCNEKAKRVALVFLGINSDHKLTKSDNFFFLPKTLNKTSIYLQQHASALILPVWDGRYTGLSGKTPEYLWSNNFVFVSPNPQHDLMNFMKDAPNVYVFNNEIEIMDIFETMVSGKLVKKQAVNKDKYTREFWADFFTNELQKLLPLKLI